MIKVNKIEPRVDGIHIFINSNGFDFEIVTEKAKKGDNPQELLQKAYDSKKQFIEDSVRKNMIFDHELPRIEDKISNIDIPKNYVLITPGVETKVELECISISEWGVEQDISDKAVFSIDGKQIDGNTFTVKNIGLMIIEVWYMEGEDGIRFSCSTCFIVEDIANYRLASDDEIFICEENLEKNLSKLQEIENHIMQASLLIEIFNYFEFSIRNPNKKQPLPAVYDEILKSRNVPMLEVQTAKEFLRQERIKRDMLRIPWPVKKNKNKEDKTNA